MGGEAEGATEGQVFSGGDTDPLVPHVQPPLSGYYEFHGHCVSNHYITVTIQRSLTKLAHDRHSPSQTIMRSSA